MIDVITSLFHIPSKRKKIKGREIKDRESSFCDKILVEKIRFNKGKRFSKISKATKRDRESANERNKNMPRIEMHADVI